MSKETLELVLLGRGGIEALSVCVKRDLVCQKRPWNLFFSAVVASRRCRSWSICMYELSEVSMSCMYELSEVSMTLGYRVYRHLHVQVLLLVAVIARQLRLVRVRLRL